MPGSVKFFYEGVKFTLKNPRKVSSWIKAAILKEEREPGQLNYIFCSDSYLLKINLHYLNHNTYTDIITFDNSDTPGLIEGDIYISIDRVDENSSKFGNTFENELHRVMIHGALHLLGYSDKSPKQKSIMRGKEDAYLSLRK